MERLEQNGYKISVRDTCTQDPVLYSLSSDNGLLVLKIGDREKTLTGEKTYEISYHYSLIMRGGTSISYLTYNLIGTGY